MATPQSFVARGGATIPLPHGGAIALTRNQVMCLVREAPADVRVFLLDVLAERPLSDAHRHMLALYFQHAAAVFAAGREAQ